MSTCRFLFLTLLALMFAQPVQAQAEHVRARYLDAEDKTLVQTDWMFLVSNPQQHAQLLFSAAYKGREPRGPAKEVDLVLWSFARTILYGERSARTLTIFADGESLVVPVRPPLPFRGETKDNQDIFWQVKRPSIGFPSPLPPDAPLRRGRGVDNLFMEQMYLRLSTEGLRKINRARNVELLVGDSRLSLTPNQMDTLRGFESLTGSSSPLAGGSGGGRPTTPAAQVQSAGAGGEAESVERGVINGEAISLPQPAYPATAASIRASGVVQVLVTVDETGAVIAARAITGQPTLRPAAEAAAKKARFSPTLLEGRAVKVTGTINYVFTLPALR